ncbi:hypothetical protein [Streptomyces collinus]|uniref:Uncharacterized protein n=1 Tax=Streptomyces collinus (strain DSM 40733 / Tue 365) TaxID=1214242 RepID=S5UTV8_STRC3|nr:hypothetical protein [Streptomyces collinus]AGS69276.1 hypothetical protein B446_12270 [Streptomyces collinus Tu 365]UJA07917.1 hypothetical protein HGI10_18180 [Streptomyces collinus]UJA17218.1 hypothetical protein HGI09_45930 [Streptomyces collinus]
MAQDRETGPGRERYPAGEDVSGATRRPDDERRPGERLPGEPVTPERLSPGPVAADRRPDEPIPGPGGPAAGEAPRAARRRDDGYGQEGPAPDERYGGHDEYDRQAVYDRSAREARAGTTAAEWEGRAGTTPDDRYDGSAADDVTGAAGSATGARDARGETRAWARGEGDGTPGTTGGTPGTTGGTLGTTGHTSGTIGHTPATAGAGREDIASGGPMPDDGLGAPSTGELSGREATTTNGRGTDSWPAAPAGARDEDRETGGSTPLLPHEETEHWESELRRTAAGFVDEPRAAVEEADRELEEIAARFGEAVTRRRRALRMSWQDEEGGRAREADTEQLRLALRDYRELAGRLLHL